MFTLKYNGRWFPHEVENTSVSLDNLKIKDFHYETRMEAQEECNKLNKGDNKEKNNLLTDKNKENEEH